MVEIAQMLQLSMRVRSKVVASPLWWSLGRAIFMGHKNDSPYFSLSCYCTDLEIVKFTEEGGTASTVESAVPTSNSNENEN